LPDYFSVNSYECDLINYELITLDYGNEANGIDDHHQRIHIVFDTVGLMGIS
jgi:hypothetical protein